MQQNIIWLVANFPKFHNLLPYGSCRFLHQRSNLMILNHLWQFDERNVWRITRHSKLDSPPQNDRKTYWLIRQTNSPKIKWNNFCGECPNWVLPEQFFRRFCPYIPGDLPLLDLSTESLQWNFPFVKLCPNMICTIWINDAKNANFLSNLS